MTDKVVDASALAAVAFLEPEVSTVRPKLAGHELHAPSLLRLELASVCLKKIRLLPSLRDQLIARFQASEQIPVRLYDVDCNETIALALRIKLSIYDASYLWLARNLSAELVTLDARLERAARGP